MNAQGICQQLKGTWHGAYGTAPCPICQPQSRRDQNALTITDKDGPLLLHCKRSNCEFIELLDAIGIRKSVNSLASPGTFEHSRSGNEERANRRAAQASACWQECISLHGTKGEVYLRNRAITSELPPSLRLHPACWHKSGRHIPALVAAITRLSGKCRPAIHRTYLQDDGIGKADVNPSKAMLGCASGGCVRIRPGEGAVVVAEGIETALSLASGIYDGPGQIIAALSASGVRNLALPHQPSTLIVAPDGDPPGREASYDLAKRASALGWAVECLDPGDGQDWNSVLQNMSANGVVIQ